MAKLPFVMPSVFRAKASPEFFQAVPLIVEVHPELNVNTAAGKIAQVLGVNIGKTIESMNMFSIVLPRGSLDDLIAIDAVRSISLDRRLYALEFAPPIPAEPIKATIDGIIPTAEAIKRVNIPALHAQNITGMNVKVAVLDTGIDLMNPQIKAEAIKLSAMKAFPSGDDENGHGTWCCTCIKGKRFQDDITGLIAQGGAPDCTLTAIKVLGYGIGTGMTSDIMEAMEMAVKQGNKVISMSLGGDGADDEDFDPMVRMINDYGEKYPDVIFVIAAGNSGPDSKTVGIPGNAVKAVTVGSWGIIDDAIAYFSSRGPTIQSGLVKPDICGCGGGRFKEENRPKENLWSGTALGSMLDPMDKVYNAFTAIQGTSMATPQVASIIALWKQMFPELTSDMVKGIFATMGKGKNSTVGHGLIDATWILSASEAPKSSANKTASQRTTPYF